MDPNKEQEPNPKRVKKDTEWTTLVTLDLEKACDVEQVREIQGQLNKLVQQAEAKIGTLKEKSHDFRDGCMVKLIDSNQSQDQDVGDNMCKREVRAKFTAGPRATTFSIDISVTSWEGELEVEIDSDLFDVHKDDLGNSNYNDLKSFFGQPSEHEIEEFLTKSGLVKAQTRITFGLDDLDEKSRKRYVYAEVINEALNLLYEKYGFEDSCGVELGIGNEEIYELLDLDY